MKITNTSLKLCGKLAFTAAVFFSCLSVANAQWTRAVEYPFVATSEPYTEVVGGTAMATTFSAADDNFVTNLPLNMNFPFCGTNYTSFTVATNGWLSLVAAPAPTPNYNNNTSFAEVSNAFPIFFPLWDDLGFQTVGGSGSARYITTGTSPNQVFTFEWKNESWDFGGIPAAISYQVKLYESGTIQFHYRRENGPVMSVETTTGWFGGSVGIARSATDYQMLDGTGPDAQSVPSPAAYRNNIDSRPRTDQVYTWLAPVSAALSGVAIMGPQEACNGKAFKLMATSQPLSVGTDCEWYTSYNGVSWSLMTQTAGVMTDVITKPTWYKVTIKNGSQSATSAPYLVNVAPHYNCYCASGATLHTDISTSRSDIGMVDLIEHNSGDTILKNTEWYTNISNNAAACKGYTDYRGLLSAIPQLYRDSTYRIYAGMIDWRTYAHSYVAAWLDYNQNGIFDPWEMIMDGQSAYTPVLQGGVLDTFKVNPDSARIGITGLRIVASKTPIDPAMPQCGSYNDGETEDYLVEISYPPCSGPVNAGTLLISDTTMCIGYDYMLTDTTYEKKQKGIMRSWQRSGDNIAWFDIQNTDNKDTLLRTFTGQPTYYRVKANCTNTGDITYSNVVFINVKESYKCYCHSQSLGGFNDSSDIGAVAIGTFSVSGGGGHLLNPKAVMRRQDYTDMQPYMMYADSTYDFYIYHTMPRQVHADAKITMFIDFNNNKQYDIPSERIYTGFTATGNFTRVGNVTIPTNVITDVPTGMRVILNNEVAPNVPSDDACGEYTSGETEDFIVTFTRILFPESVAGVAGISNVSLYPNPTTGKANISFTGVANEVNVLVTNITGQQVLHNKYQHKGGSFNAELDLNGNAKGIYLVELSVGGQRMVRKLVLQ
jgi:hypothetical protein